jgi:glycosyltransferase involved in cell wall biosynthesis
MNVLIVIPGLQYSGTGKQVILLARGLLAKRFRIRVCVLGAQGPLGAPFRTAGLEAEVLGWTRLMDARPWWRLRQLLRTFAPNIIHAWGLPALRAAVLVGRRVRTVSSAAHPLLKLGKLDEWLLRRTDRVVAAWTAEKQAFQRHGVSAGNICCIPPGVEAAPLETSDRQRLDSFPDWANTGRLVLCVGRLDPRKGFHDAIWAFDILKYLYEDLHLAIVGEGPDRPRLEGFARSIGVADRVHFLGHQSDIARWFLRAELIWVPSRATGSTDVALEAMAAARPVVASKLPGLADVIVDGSTGYLVEPGDKVALARQSHLLLADSNRRRQFGNAGHHRACGEFDVAHLVQGYAALYESLAG